MRRVRHGSTVYTLELDDPVDRTDEDPRAILRAALPLARTLVLGSASVIPPRFEVGSFEGVPAPSGGAAVTVDAVDTGAGVLEAPVPRCALCDAVIVLPETTGGVCGWCFFHARTANRQRWWVRALRWLAS